MKDAAAREHEDTETDATGRGLRVPFSGEGGGGDSLDEPRRARAARGRIAKLVAVKLALDLVFVGAFALYTHAVTFGRGFDGALEHADGRGARGWVVDLGRPGAAVEVQVFENGRFLASTVADAPRPGDATGERRGFAFEFEPPLRGDREIRVYAVRARRDGTRRTVEQFGERVSFAWK